jgi:alpha,alpha-trehalose phosphorylase
MSILQEHPWQLIESAFDRERMPHHETLFALGNGHIGVRGALEDGPAHQRATFINGFYDSAPIVYGESQYGYATEAQTMVEVADGQSLALSIDGEPIRIDADGGGDQSRVLDLKAGYLRRTLRRRLANGADVTVAWRRIVSLTRKSVVAFEVSLVSDIPVRLEVCAAVDAQSRQFRRIVNMIDMYQTNQMEDPHAPGVVFRDYEPHGDAFVIRQSTRRSGLDLACSVREQATPGGTATRQNEAGRVTSRWTVDLPAGETFRLTRFLAYRTSLDGAGADADLAAAAATDAGAAWRGGFDGLLEEQAAYLASFWDQSNMEIEGDSAMDFGLRFSMFHLLQSAGTDGRRSMSAKGLGGNGYEGHYFWDTEIFGTPFFIYTQPAIAKALLGYRHHTLDRARARARELHFKGALYPWRTIGGAEASAYFPAGTAQYHIDADIAYTVGKYYDATGDDAFLEQGGAEIVFETARFFRDLGSFNPERGGAFCLYGVTGPDEYNALIDNNFYTNLMARNNFLLAARFYRKPTPGLAPVLARLGIGQAEVAEWERAAAQMLLAVDEAKGIYKKDDSFLHKPEWPFTPIPPDPEHTPLLRYFHPLELFRYKVIKQTDLLLALAFFSDQFDAAMKKRCYDYYSPYITGDSSLSACGQSLIASEVGDAEAAYGFFRVTARMDLDDIHMNAKDGVHIAAMGGTWIAVVMGFGGLRVVDGILGFRPRLPAGWTRLTFPICFQGRRLKVAIDRAGTTYRLIQGAALTLRHEDQMVTLKSGETRRV